MTRTGARPRRGPIVAIEGSSGAGKTTATLALARRRDLPVLREAVERLRPPRSIAYRSFPELERLERALLREEGRRFREAQRRAESGRAVLLDTGVLGPLTYTAGLVALGRAPLAILDTLVADARRLAGRRAWGLPDAVLFLATPAAARRARADADPEGHPRSLRERHEAVGRIEGIWYTRVLAPVLGDRFRIVSGRGSAEIVANRLDAVLSDLAPVASRPSGVRAVLDLVPVLATGEVGAPPRPPRGNR
jgi:thymidylate kinase